MMAVMLMVTFVVTAVVTVTMAEKPCCYPEQYEGVLGMMTQTLGRTPSRTGSMAFYSIDYTNERVASFEQRHRYGRTVNMSVIHDFKAQKQYTVFWEKKWCCTKSVSLPMRPRCALDNATFKGTGYFGTGDSALLTTAWGIHMSMPRLRFSSEIVVTSDNCVPFSQRVEGRSESTPFIQLVTYLNNTLGIKDPGVFTPPDFCKKDDFAPYCILTSDLPAATQHIVDSVTTTPEDA